MVQQFFESGFGETFCGGFVGDGVAELLEVEVGCAAEAVVLLDGYEDGDLFLIALDEDWLVLSGVEEGDEFGFGIGKPGGIATWKTPLLRILDDVDRLCARWQSLHLRSRDVARVAELVACDETALPSSRLGA